MMSLIHRCNVFAYISKNSLAYPSSNHGSVVFHLFHLSIFECNLDFFTNRSSIGNLQRSIMAFVPSDRPCRKPFVLPQGFFQFFCGGNQTTSLCPMEPILVGTKMLAEITGSAVLHVSDALLRPQEFVNTTSMVKWFLFKKKIWRIQVSSIQYLGITAGGIS